jgi:hypothetical protein
MLENPVFGGYDLLYPYAGDDWHSAINVEEWEENAFKCRIDQGGTLRLR